ncbi:MAG: (S)-ureidoglycine aminohydrolase [Planctomycetes bacterium]|nr:(S)-ureidoglycine aminohydrolase [Planctomycetota bacterium]
MELFGSTRSRVTPQHALITPDTNVPSVPPGWVKTKAFVLISPRMGADFTQYIASMEEGGTAAPALPGVERVIYVLEGELALAGPKKKDVFLRPGGFAYFPPDGKIPQPFQALTMCRLNVFEKRYVPLPGTVPPAFRHGQEQDIPGDAFLGDPDARLKVLLPTTPDFDLAVNVFTYQPGAALPQVEIHVMEHGLLMLDGQGVYRLGDDWYPVKAGDVIWMAPYCPQWFVAMGKSPARYLYYKDVNRDPLEVAHG